MTKWTLPEQKFPQSLAEAQKIIAQRDDEIEKLNEKILDLECDLQDLHYQASMNG